MFLEQQGKSLKGFLEKDRKKIDQILFILLIIQPLLDVFSFFMVENNMTIFSTLMRMALFGVVTLYTFIISDNKKAYFIAAGILGVFWILHMVGCFMEGYQSIYQDLAMFVRTVQMPVFTLCFITIFKKGNDVPKTIRTAFVCNYIIISAVIIASYAVGMPESAYPTGIGVKGWFAISNAQSCIISLLAPLTLYWAVKNKNKILSLIVVIIAYANLFFYGTKVSYYFIFISLFSMIFFMVINKKKDIAMYVILIGCMVVCGGAYKYSPCYENNYLMQASMDEWDADISKIQEEDKAHKDPQEKLTMKDYEKIYNLYNGELVDRFGIEKVVEKYNYSTYAVDLIDNRKLKVNYSSLMMDEKGKMAHLFGFEYMDFVHDGESFEPENDFPAVYFSNGIVGLAMYLIFIAYFLVLIVMKLFKKFWKTLTLEAGAVGTTLVLMLGAAQLSGNVLRRPNVTIYFSLILAYVYYLCKLQKEEIDE